VQPKRKQYELSTFSYDYRLLLVVNCCILVDGTQWGLFSFQFAKIISLELLNILLSYELKVIKNLTVDRLLNSLNFIMNAQSG